MATKTVKNTETENKETKATKAKETKPKATTKKEKAETVQTSELPEQSTAETTAVTVPEQTTDVYSADFVKEAAKKKNQIKIEYGKVESSYLKIAFSIHWLHDNSGYKPLGYGSIYDLAKEEFNIARGTTCNFINIVGRFGERDELGNFTGKLAEKYEPFSSSKLSLMLDLTDEEIEQFTPDMSVREMKKKIKLLIDDSEKTTERLSSSGNGGFSQSFDGNEKEEEIEIVRQALITCNGLEDYQKKIDNIDECIMSAFKAHPDCKIEIVYVTAKEKTEEETEEGETEE